MTPVRFRISLSPIRTGSAPPRHRHLLPNQFHHALPHRLASRVGVAIGIAHHLSRWSVDDLVVPDLKLNVCYVWLHLNIGECANERKAARCARAPHHDERCCRTVSSLGGHPRTNHTVCPLYCPMSSTFSNGICQCQLDPVVIKCGLNLASWVSG